MRRTGSWNCLCSSNRCRTVRVTLLSSARRSICGRKRPLLKTRDSSLPYYFSLTREWLQQVQQYREECDEAERRRLLGDTGQEKTVS